MIHAGTDLKYKVTAQIPGFSLRNNDFSVLVKNRWNQVKYIIEKEDMLTDDDGNYYFTLTDIQNGYYYAVLMAHREDTDFDSGLQNVVDSQFLCAVGVCDDEACNPCRCQTDGMSVAYQRVWTVNVAGYVYLAEEDGTPILDANGNKIFLKKDPDDEPFVRLDMTGEALKELLESRNHNGKIDTIPEMMDAAGGMEEDTEYSVSTNEDMDNMMDRIFNS